MSLWWGVLTSTHSTSMNDAGSSVALPQPFLKGLILTTEVIRKFNSYVIKGGPDECWMWQGGIRYGYGFIIFPQGVRRIKLQAHRLSFIMAGGELTDDKPCVCHKCDVRGCVRPDHLWAGSQADNMADMRSKGRGSPETRGIFKRRAQGEEHGQRKLTDEIVRSVRARYRQGGVSQKAIASELGVTQSIISDVIRGVSWKHIP